MKWIYIWKISNKQKKFKIKGQQRKGKGKMFANIGEKHITLHGNKQLFSGGQKYFN